MSCFAGCGEVLHIGLTISMASDRLICWTHSEEIEVIEGAVALVGAPQPDHDDAY